MSLDNGLKLIPLNSRGSGGHVGMISRTKSGESHQFKAKTGQNVYATVFFPDAQRDWVHQTVLLKGSLGQIGFVWSSPWVPLLTGKQKFWGPLLVPVVENWEPLENLYDAQKLWVDWRVRGDVSQEKSSGGISMENLAQTASRVKFRFSLSETKPKGLRGSQGPFIKQRFCVWATSSPSESLPKGFSDLKFFYENLSIWKSFGLEDLVLNQGKNQVVDQNPSGGLSSGSVSSKGLRSKFPKKLEYSVKKRLKDFINGLTHGYATNLELRGLGFKGQVESFFESLSLKPQGFQTSTVSARNMVSAVSDQIKGSEKHSYTSIKTGSQVFLWERYFDGIWGALWFRESYTQGVLKLVKFLLEQQQGQALLSKKTRLNFKLGLSHNLVYTTQSDASVKLDIIQGSSPSVTVFGITPWAVNQVAYEIYAYKKPEPYQGKGIRYPGEKFYGKKGRGKD